MAVRPLAAGADALALLPVDAGVFAELFGELGGDGFEDVVAQLILC